MKENDTMIMEYDTGFTTTFKITYLGSRKFEKGNGMHYPYIIDGKDSGMIDDITSDELKCIVDHIDKTGKSDCYVLEWMEGIIKYMIIETLDKNNLHMKLLKWMIKKEFLNDVVYLNLSDKLF